MVITLDGYSACGKSTLAKALAKKLRYNYLNSGMIYRALSYFFMEKNINHIQSELIKKELEDINIDVIFINGEQNVIINKINYSSYVNSKIVQENVANYACVLEIRNKVKIIQHNLAKNSNIIVEGRDSGTNIFPNAKHKFFIVCDLETRAKRRLNDLTLEGQNITLNEVITSLKSRDEKDVKRTHGPLIKPQDAFVIDTTSKTIDECIDEMIEYINKN